MLALLFVIVMFAVTVWGELLSGRERGICAGCGRRRRLVLYSGRLGRCVGCTRKWSS